MWPQGGINLEFNCVAISMTVKNRLAGMVEYEVDKVGRQWVLLCCCWLPSMEQRSGAHGYRLTTSWKFGDRREHEELR